MAVLTNKPNKCERVTVYKCTVAGRNWEMCGFCELTWLEPDICRHLEANTFGSFCRSPEAIAAADGGSTNFGRNNG